jgi:hypothetical protein
MFDDLAAYYHEDVVSSFLAYREVRSDSVSGRSRDLRHALIAATALFHLREHLPAGTLSRAAAERLCPDYALLGDVVNAAKHKSLTAPTPHGTPLLTKATNLGEELVSIQYEDSDGTYLYAQKTVVVELDDGAKRDLLEVLTNVMNFWEQQMASLGVISAPRTFSYEDGIHARTRAECEPHRTVFEIVQGVRWRQAMRFLRFDSKTGKATPVDLSAGKLSGRIYRPRLDLDLALTNSANGKESKTTVTLTEDESAHVSQMTDDAERQAFVSELPAVRAALQQLAIDVGLLMIARHE